MEIKKTKTFNCSTEKLWSWLNDFQKVKQWNKSILNEKHISIGEVRVGFISEVLINEASSQTWYRSEIQDYKIHQLLKFSLKGGKLGENPMIIEYELFDKNNKTLLNYKCSWEPGSFILKMAQPFISNITNKNADKALQELSKLINQ
ncbi:MAG: SRPBCC family protein [Saprospiraceae bacterium]|nr:SRPBCC family protein [Saprospiraceae bacterium]